MFAHFDEVLFDDLFDGGFHLLFVVVFYREEIQPAPRM